MATAAAARHQHQHQQRRGAQRGRRRGSGIRCSSPAQEFASLAAVFRRRLVVGATTAAAAAVGANFGGVTSFLLGLSPELGRSLRLDVLYPVGGFTRCLDSDNGFGKRPPPPPPTPTPLFHLPLPPTHRAQQSSPPNCRPHVLVLQGFVFESRNRVVVP
jgi:hypothetical protein